MTVVAELGSPAASNVDIARILDDGTWGATQKGMLALVACAIVLDGFDNQVLGFAIPLLIKEWHVGREVFAGVFAVGFLGMVIGTAIGGWLGDRIGRKTALIGSVLIFGVATGATAMADTVEHLTLFRFLAGLGLGGAMPCATTLIAEFTPARRRSLAVTIGIVCIPLGGVIGGLIAARVLPAIGWRALFGIAGILPIGIALLLALLLVESPLFLLRIGKEGAARAVMARFGKRVPADAALRDSSDRRDLPQASIWALLSGEFRGDTIALCAGFFFCLLSTYLVFSWAPTFLTGSGFSVAQASTGLAIFNIGGVIGALAAAQGMERAGSRRVLGTCAVAAAIGAGFLAAGSLNPADIAVAYGALLVEGALINAVQIGLYALAAHVYPVAVRASGVGAAAGIGRAGALASAFVGVAVLAGGAPSYFGAIAVAMGATALALILIRRHAPPVASLAAAAVVAPAASVPSL